MKPHLNPLLAVLVAANCGLALAGTGTTGLAAGTTTEPRIETRTIFVNGDDITDPNQLLADADVFPAQALTGRTGREVQVRVMADKDMQIAAMPPVPPLPPVPPIPPIPPLADIDVLISNAMSEAFSGAAGGFAAFSRKPVKNAPYSAEVISEKIQLLPDGNQISRRTSSMAYRDSAGRTRQDVRDDKGEVRTIQINDAVDGTRYVLSPSKKSATRIALDQDIARRVEDIREKARTMAKQGKALIIERGEQGEDIIVKRVESVGPDGKKGTSEEVNVRVIRLSGDPKIGANYSGVVGMHNERIETAMSDELSRSTIVANSFHDGKWSGKATTTQLGTKDFDGLRAEGKSVSYTIPAGEVGNKNPILVSTETWTSPDLQVVVYSKHSDPRSGDSIYRLANVKRAEQPLSLFRVPDDYTTRNSRAMGAPVLPIPPVPAVPPSSRASPSTK